MIIIDGFLESYNDLKNHIESAVFSDVVNPVDGVTYPHICVSIPDNVRQELDSRIRELIGRDPVNCTVFMRKSPEGVHVPHIAHTDNSMGSMSLMLYCNEYGGGGTAMIRHKESGICYAPESEKFLKVVQNDQNDPEKWAVVDMAHMKENRAVIFDASSFHCAMPIGGFGHGAQARTVLTAFFS